MLHEVVFIDFDGVIVNSYDICFDILIKAQSNLTPEKIRHQLDRNLVEQVAHMQETLHVDFWSIYHEKIHDQPIIEEISEAIERAATGHPLFIIASSPASDITEYLSKYKLSHFFEDILGAETSDRKIDLFDAMIKKHQIPTKESVYITDTFGDILEAHQYNIQPIAVTWGLHDEEKLHQGNPTTIIESPTQLAGAIEEAFDFSEEYD